MATSFPTALDVLVNPSASDTLNNPLVYHDVQHANANDAIEALEAKVGVDSSAVTTSLDYKAANHAHTGSDGSVAIAHASLGSVGTDDHHAKSHAHNGADGSGTVAYADLTSKPTLGTASSRDVPPSGDATSEQVVLGNDSRLTDSRAPIAHSITGALHTITASQYQLVGATATDTLGLLNLYDLILKDTKANILAATATAGRLAYATDTYEFYVADGTNWRKAPFALVSEPQAPDMGYLQDSSRIGYGTNYVTDKLVANCQIGSNAKTTLADGDVRVSSGALQVYLSGAWKDVVTGFRLREDDSGYLVFEHKPTGMTEWLEINSGNSNTLGLNGLPMIQQYGASMGAYPVPLHVDGGTF